MNVLSNSEIYTPGLLQFQDVFSLCGGEQEDKEVGEDDLVFHEDFKY